MNVKYMIQQPTKIINGLLKEQIMWYCGEVLKCYSYTQIESNTFFELNYNLKEVFPEEYKDGLRFVYDRDGYNPNEILLIYGIYINDKADRYENIQSKIFEVYE